MLPPLPSDRHRPLPALIALPSARTERIVKLRFRLEDITRAEGGIALRQRIVALMGLDTSNATGKLMLNVIGAVAQFEREMMLERQREGIAKAQSEGKYKGRKPTVRNQAAEIARLHAEGIANASG